MLLLRTTKHCRKRYLYLVCSIVRCSVHFDSRQRYTNTNLPFFFVSHYVIDCCIVYLIVKYVPTTSFYCLSFSTFLCLFNFFILHMIDCCMSPPIYSHPFEHIPSSLFSFSSIAQLDKLCVYIGGFIPSFIYYCNIHSFITAIILPQSTFLSSFLRVQCILYIENIPRQVMISSYKVRHQQHLHRHQHCSVVGTWTTVSSTAKIDTNARIPTWYDELTPSDAPTDHSRLHNILHRSPSSKLFRPGPSTMADACAHLFSSCLCYTFIISLLCWL